MRVDFSSPQSIMAALEAKDAEIERLMEVLSEIIERLDQGQMAEPRDVASLALKAAVEQSLKQKGPPHEGAGRIIG